MVALGLLSLADETVQHFNAKESLFFFLPTVYCFRQTIPGTFYIYSLDQ
jgi:hypothetical protein